MSRKYKFRDQTANYFVSFATIDWVDVFIRRQYKDLMVDSLNYCVVEKKLIIYGWVIMSNHVHLIIGTDDMKVHDIMRDLKKYTSKALIEAIKNNPLESRKKWMLKMFEKAGSNNSNNQKYQFWQQHNMPIVLNNMEIFEQKLNYIHENPVKAGFVDSKVDYPYSSARDYAGKMGLVKILLAF
jgi:REP element-mobilizing transposase RayT